MPGKIAQTEWPACNLTRAYPWALDASREDASGTLRVPEAAFAALYLPVPAALAYAPGAIYVGRLVAAPGAVVLELYSQLAAPGTGPIAAASVPLPGTARLAPVPLVGRGPLAGCVGSVTAGDPEILASLPPGRFAFSADAGRLATDCIRPTVPAVSRVEVRAAGRVVATLRGPVRIQGGRNLRASMAGVGTIRLDALADAADLAADCGCGEPARPPIRSINGVSGPDVELRGGDCVAVAAGDGGLVLSDPCATPCCDDADAAAMLAQIYHLRDRVDEVARFAARLERAADHLERDVLSARLADDGCRPEDLAGGGS